MLILFMPLKFYCLRDLWEHEIIEQGKKMIAKIFSTLEIIHAVQIANAFHRNTNILIISIRYSLG